MYFVNISSPLLHYLNFVELNTVLTTIFSDNRHTSFAIKCFKLNQFQIFLKLNLNVVFLPDVNICLNTVRLWDAFRNYEITKTVVFYDKDLALIISNVSSRFKVLGIIVMLDWNNKSYQLTIFV